MCPDGGFVDFGQNMFGMFFKFGTYAYYPTVVGYIDVLQTDVFGL